MEFVDFKSLLWMMVTTLGSELPLEVARSSGAIDVATGEGLAEFCSGDGPMRLGNPCIGDYVRENMSIARQGPARGQAEERRGRTSRRRCAGTGDRPCAAVHTRPRGIELPRHRYRAVVA